MRLFYAIIGLLFGSGLTYGQSYDRGFFEKEDEFNARRFYPLVGSSALLITGSYVVLNQAWYANYERESFHLFDDNSSWLQVDKVGHAFSAYQLGHAGIELLEWSGVPKTPSTWIGGSIGLLYLSGIEIMDGHSAKWGFSWGDMIANTSGTGLVIGQELLWGEQRIRMKFSYHPSKFAEQSPEFLGRNFQESILKDYNGQSYWLSANVNALSGSDFLPDWLNIAVGYGGHGMLHPEPWAVGEQHLREFYLSPDIDLSRIKVKSPFWRTLLKTLNFIKIPAPTLSYREDGQWQFHPVYF